MQKKEIALKMLAEFSIIAVGILGVVWALADESFWWHVLLEIVVLLAILIAIVVLAYLGRHPPVDLGFMLSLVLAAIVFPLIWAGVNWTAWGEKVQTETQEKPAQVIEAWGRKKLAHTWTPTHKGPDEINSGHSFVVLNVEGEEVTFESQDFTLFERVRSGQEVKARCVYETIIKPRLDFKQKKLKEVQAITLHTSSP